VITRRLHFVAFDPAGVSAHRGLIVSAETRATTGEAPPEATRNLSRVDIFHRANTGQIRV